MSAILDRTKVTLEAVGRESESSNGLWRLTLSAFGFVTVSLISVLTYEATDIKATINRHTAALMEMDKRQDRIAERLIEQNQNVNKAVAETGAIETRTRNLEDNFNKIDGKLDVLITVVKSPPLP